MAEYFTNSSGIKLGYKLTQKKESNEVVVFCHGKGGSMDSWFYPSVVDSLPTNTFQFDFTGNGTSEGEFTYSGYEQEAKDLNDAVNFLRTKNYHVKAVIGHSKAADVVIIYSAIFSEVPNIIALAPRFNMQTLPEVNSAFYEKVFAEGQAEMNTASGTKIVTAEQIRERQSVNMQSYSERARGNIYLVHGTLDTIIPFEDSEKFAEVLGDKLKDFYRLECDHFFEGKLDDLKQILKDLLNQL